ncbi:MAG TPA: carbon-nitrogen hydrolase family protein [Candidatus Dormibacteraeota bacterium]|nr:carbon-nitrogen hydrolase family protein [Candidatus Dormibacteraeota bacterium]
MRGVVRIGACQTPEILGDEDAAVACIKEFAERADADLLLFPECFLQGYLITEAHVRRHALDLNSTRFRSVLSRLADVRPALVLGMIERAGSRVYNAAVVLEQGRVAGVYRKAHLRSGESLFERGDRYPVFEVRGVRFGINICHDTRFPGAAAQVAAHGARVLLVPAQNMMRRRAAEEWKDRHNEIRAQRVRETGMWLLSADVTGERGDTHVGYGPTSVMNPIADLVAQVPLMQTGMVVAEIPG